MWLEVSYFITVEEPNLQTQLWLLFTIKTGVREKHKELKILKFCLKYIKIKCWEFYLTNWLVAVYVKIAVFKNDYKLMFHKVMKNKVKSPI